MTSHAGLCFCCSQLPFTECCEPILTDHSRALTPLALMRSRYTAYVLGRETHLLNSWAPDTRPESLNLADSKTKWLELIIHSESIDPTDDNHGQVDFSARFMEHDQVCELREKSIFIRQAGLWYYFGGTPRITRNKIGRNGLCPCGSGKKYKRCCLDS